MVGEIELLFALAGRIHVLLRRENGRITDIEWMCADISYAKEVLRLANATDSDELHKLVERVEQVYPQFARQKKSVVQPSAAQSPVAAKEKYINTLR